MHFFDVHFDKPLQLPQPLSQPRWLLFFLLTFLLMGEQCTSIIGKWPRPSEGYQVGKVMAYGPLGWVIPKVKLVRGTIQVPGDAFISASLWPISAHLWSLCRVELPKMNIKVHIEVQLTKPIFSSTSSYRHLLSGTWCICFQLSARCGEASFAANI